MFAQSGDGCSLPAAARQGPSVYRPRHPERTTFYQLFERHFDDYRYAYEERYEHREGPLRPVVEKSVQAFLDCGRPHGGFSRLRCPGCKAECFLSFSCATRNFCPSCQAKRAALFAERLQEEILAEVPHRHFIFTIPIALRGLFQRERSLLGLLSRTAYEAIAKAYRAYFDRDDVRPGCVTSIQTFGSFGANFHPHLHALVTDGVFDRDGEFLSLITIDTKAIELLFRDLLLRRLNQAHRLSDTFMEKLLNWRPSGFSVYGEQTEGRPVALPSEPDRVDQLARYLTRPPLAASAVSLDDDGRVHVKTPPDPKTGATEMIMDPLDWIHLITSQIPDPRLHLTRFYGAYANRVRSSILPKRSILIDPPVPSTHADEDDEPYVKARKASWGSFVKSMKPTRFCAHAVD